MWLAALLLAAAPAADPDSLPKAMERAVADYERELARVESSEGRISIEPLFSQAHTFCETLSSGWRTEMDLESLSEESFSEVQRRLPGLVVFRDETVGAVVDNVFFDSLAQARGTPADTAALGLYRREYEYNLVAPAWIEWRTDFGGCTQFGTGLLTRYYGYWTNFRAAYPGRYEHLVSYELQQIEDALLEGVCLCGYTDIVVLDELDGFLRAFPTSPLAPRIRQRLEAVRTKQVMFHFNCSPG